MKILTLQTPGDLFIGKEHLQTCLVGDFILVPEFVNMDASEIYVPEPPPRFVFHPTNKPPERSNGPWPRRRFRRVRTGEKDHVIVWERIE